MPKLSTIPVIALLVMLMITLFAGLGTTGCASHESPAGARTPAGPVVVLYAGSLVNLMESDLSPAFQNSSGYVFEGVPGGSAALANQIKGRLRRADVFVSASPAVNQTLMGQDNGNWVQWYVTFAKAPLVIGYNPKSRFAHDLTTKPWYQVLAEPGFRLGRTDPKLDPKGALTVQLVDKASRYYHLADLAARVLGAEDNPAQVFPEEDLVGRLQAGQLDAGFFYINEAKEQHIPYVTLPEEITPQAQYTVTIPRGEENPPGAIAFVEFLLGPQGRAILAAHGLTVLKPSLTGDAASVPSALRALVGP